MANLSSIDASLLKGSQETQIALAHANFDFSLVKIEAPIEYQAVGRQLTQKRKNEAEFGQLHVTARKLTALFQGLIPKVPALVQAYGKRASEIASMPEINPKGTQKQHGPFQDYIGIDGASIWASATSGNDAIAMHLLACMLARMWDSRQGTSIWSELIEKRKEVLTQQLKGNVQTGTPYHIAEEKALQVTIERASLRDWDASARSWLACADRAKAKQHHQLRLMIENLSMPITSSTDVYQAITIAWPQTLVAMNDLILGRPQQINDGAILLSMSAWHIYPPMTVVTDNVVEVEQDDPLVARGGTLTMLASRGPQPRLDSAGGLPTGVFWSLRLAHLKYYGRPTRLDSKLDLGSSLISLEDFWFVILGIVLSTWGLADADLAVLKRFLLLLSGSPDDDENPATWSKSLYDTVQKLDSTHGRDDIRQKKLFGLGKRYGSRNVPGTPGLSRAWTPEKLNLQAILNYDFMMDVDESKRVNYVRSCLSRMYDVDVLKSLIVSVRTYGKTDWAFSVLPLHSGDHSENPVTWTFRRGEQPVAVTEDVPTAKFGPRYMSYLSRFKKSKMPSSDRNHQIYCKVEDWDGQVEVWAPSQSYDFCYTELRKKSKLSLEQLCDFMDAGLITSRFLRSEAGPRGSLLDIMHYATQLYPRHLHWKVDLNGVLYRALPALNLWLNDGLGIGFEPSCLEMAFFTIIFFKFGCFVQPSDLSGVVAVAFSDSILVASYLIRGIREYDTLEIVEALPGSLGRPGICLIRPTVEPLMPSSTIDKWQLVSHAPFLGDEMGDFDRGWITMTPTGYEMPVALKHEDGYQDALITAVEARFAFYNADRWLADINPVLAGQSINWRKKDMRIACSHTVVWTSEELQSLQFNGIANWDEMLDLPTTKAVFLGGGNAQARMIALCLGLQSMRHCVVPLDTDCWQCLLSQEWTAEELPEGFIDRVRLLSSSSKGRLFHLPDNKIREVRYLDRVSKLIRVEVAKTTQVPHEPFLII